jgi:multisubunit Na+/H+ antiporter MnhF subunit
MSSIVTMALNVSLVLHILMIAVCVWKVWRGRSIIDRLIGADLVVTLTLAVLVIVALIRADSIYLDVAMGLAVLGFVGTVALSRYISDHHLY